MIVNLPPALRIVSIADKNNPANERVHLAVDADCNLSSYLLMATVLLADGRIYAGFRPTYWFAEQAVKKGDQVIVYTKKGAESKDVQTDGHTNYFLYWGCQNPLFGPAARVVLAELNAWVTGGEA